MKTAWTKGLTGQNREEIIRDFGASAILRQRLIYILNEKINTKRIKKVSEDLYSSPSWPFMQADSVGYERAISEVISLLSQDSSKL